MRIALLGLTACWSNPAPKAPPAAPQATATFATEAPEPPPPPAYRLPAQVADALASEPLAGFVVVGGDAQLMATAATARTNAARRGGAAILGRVVKDHGDVVEIETDTKRTQDCIGSFTQPYQLTVFVRRAQLVPRTKVEVTKAFPDGTAVAINAGTPVAITGSGLAWTGTLSKVPVSPVEDQLAYGLFPGTAAKLPAQSADPMICDGNESPVTLTAWRDAARAKRESEARARQEALRLEAEAQRAQWEANRPERERAQAAALRKCKAAAKKKRKAAKQDNGILGQVDTCALQTMFGSDMASGLGSGGGLGSSLGAGGPSAWERERFAPYCSVVKPWSDDTDKPKQVASPKLGGKPMPWPDREQNSVSHVGGKYLADIEYGCGRVRVSVDEAALGNGGRGMGYGSIGGLGGQAQVQVWVPKPGAVTWPDGSPAGRYTGNKRYQTVVEQDTRICVKVPGVGEMVCHDKATAKTEMVSPSMLRDRD